MHQFLTPTEIPMPARDVRGLAALLSDPSATSAEEAAAAIACDPPMAAVVMSAANSPYFGFHRSIASIRDAACLLGPHNLRQMVQRADAAAADAHLDRRLTSLADHSRAVALAARMVARRVYFPNRDKAYAAGLLHDIGKFLIAAGSVDEQAEIDRLVLSYRIPSSQAELLVLGEGHAEIGARSLARWDLPETIVEAVRLHHHPTRAAESLDLSGIVSLANIVAHWAGLGGEVEIYELDPVLLDYFGLSRSSLVSIQRQLEDLWPGSEMSLTPSASGSR